jgi:opacity protein-like surface antigen
LSASRGSAHATKVGWTAGGSAEFALSDHFTIKGEALSYGAEQGSAVIARAGLNYKF